MTTIKLPIWAIVLIVVGLVAAGYFTSMWYERMRARRDVTVANNTGNAFPEQIVEPIAEPALPLSAVS